MDLANLVLRVLGAPPGAPPRWPTIGGDYGHIYHGDNLPNVRVVTYRGRVVSSVGIYPTEVRTPRGAISVGGINAFVTHPDHRRQGLGGAVLRDAHDRMRASGQHVGLLSTRIQDYYRKFGWESAGRQQTWVFDRGNVALLPDSAGLTVTEDWRSHLPELVALHDSDDLGAHRGASPRSGCWPSASSVACLSRGAPAAWPPTLASAGPPCGNTVAIRERSPP